MLLPLKKNSTLSFDCITPEQQSAITRLYENHCLLIARKGFGKAMIAQTAAQELLRDGVVSQVLVLAPLKVCQLTWATEWKKWEHLEEPALALGSPAVRTAALVGDKGIVVLNFENVAWAAENGLLAGFDGLVIDEISKCKAAGGSIVKALRHKLKQFKWRVGMSATPVAETGVDIYAQALLVDNGRALGRTVEGFRRTYFYPTDYEQRKWDLQPGAGERLAAALGDLVYMADDGSYESSLPPLVDYQVAVELPEQARQAYDEMCEEMALEVDEEEVEAVNAAVLTGKLQQISAGAVYLDTGKARRTIWLHFAKFYALDKLVTAAVGPVLIGYQYQFELDELVRRYRGIAVLGDNPVENEYRWNRGELRLMAVHPRSASHGLNLQYGGHQLIVLTPPWGADHWDQLIGRLRRRGQTAHSVTRTTLVCTDTVDELVLERHLQKAGNEAALMDHIRAHGRGQK